MEDKFKSKYGFFGWQEFLTNRQDLIQEFEKALAKNINRPVRTSHGNAGEAAVRKLFQDFLPKKYGVTSGYIIPDIICQEYVLFHYDIIIYDNLNSPILWIEADYDDSAQGKKRAIPAEYVFSVVEVKSTFNKKNIRNAMNKLSDLNSLKEYLPKEFTCSTFFFEIKNNLKSKPNVLEEFLSEEVYGFRGGIILKSEINTEMTGLIEQIKIDDNNESHKNKNRDLVKDIDKIDMKINEKGNIRFKGKAGWRLYTGKNGHLHFNKVHYSPIINSGENGIMLSWSHNNFTKYIINLLGSLEGKDFRSKGLPVFGQVFDLPDIEKAPLQNNIKENGKPFLELQLYDGNDDDKQIDISKDEKAFIIKFTIEVINSGDCDIVISDDSFKNEVKLPKGKKAYKISSFKSKEPFEVLEKKGFKIPYRVVYFEEEKPNDFIAVETSFLLENGTVKMV
ncbi:DUF6602 domain-containing protein [Psychroflexus planctonicus]|uniref:DUF6602 domain-containing protein n=1 Tax=Psychroflexus planctonicus TaxID=1526575 RepID=A0ABQ1SN37_9FLAO|nr:DUF6602 domain-containing protein [Psychroflexus planctonicus]GGE43016.1 hypothetical protein GCM10010832_23720 [Psychroflexus planctonicus]